MFWTNQGERDIAVPVPEEARLAMVGPSHFSPSYLSGDFPNLKVFFQGLFSNVFRNFCISKQLISLVSNHRLCTCESESESFFLQKSHKSPRSVLLLARLDFFVASFISSACAGVLLHLWLLPAPLPHRLPLLHHDPQASHSGDDSGLWESNSPWKNRLILICLWYVTMHNVPVVK